jgi:UDP-2,3-diacylglucosamine pyrophosphatase LpxH
MAKNAISEENALLLLENAFTRERFDWQLWDLRQMKQSVELMKKIVSKINKTAATQDSFATLEKFLGELGTIIDQKDATRVIAGHTHVEQALSELRDVIFGL